MKKGKYILWLMMAAAAFPSGIDAAQPIGVDCAMSRTCPSLSARVDLTANATKNTSGQYQVNEGSSLIITWDNKSAHTCKKSGAWSGTTAAPLANGDVDGSETVYPSAGVKTYTMECYGYTPDYSFTGCATTSACNFTTMYPMPCCSGGRYRYYASRDSISVNVVPRVNGSCGTAAKNYTPSNTGFSGTFCGAGTASPSSPSFPSPGNTTTWNCNGTGGGSNATCSAYRIAPPTINFWADAYTVAYGGRTMLRWTTANATSCTAGAGPYPWTGSRSISGSEQTTYLYSTTYYDMTCTGPGGSVSANLTINVSVPVNGSCGPSNGQTMPAAPAAGLCNAGTPSAVSGSGPWNWTCAGSNGGGNASCVAYKTPAPACGTAARTYLSTETNFSGAICAVGNASPASPTFPAPGGTTNWTCANGAGSADCAASRWNVLNPPSNLQASCNVAGNQVSLSWTGSTGANYYPLRVDDKINGWDGSCASPDQCIDISGTSYTRAVVPGRDYRAWVHACRSADGQCTSPAILDNFRCDPPPVNGTCGPAARSYAHDETSYSGALCSSGSPSPANPAFPAQGGSSAWSCSGSNGGSSANCTATRGVPPVCTGTRPTNTSVHPGDDTGLAANTAWTYSAANTAPKCQYYCSSGYNWNGSSCAPIVNGSCGPSNGQTMPSAPTSGLCNVGTPSAVSGSGPWNWTCAGSNGGGNASCTAYPPSAVNAICGSNQPASFRYEANVNSWPSTDQTAFCQSGSLTPSSPIPVFPAQGGNTTWNCDGSNGGNDVSCTVMRKLEGICGPSSGQTMPSAPTGGLCGSGSPTAVSGTGPWTWSCVGANGGITRSCSANKTNGPILMFTGFDAGNASNSGSEITIPYGGAVLLTWSTQHVASCQASDGSGSWANPNKPTSGTDERYENIRSETTFTLNCVGIDGSPIAGSVIVRVPAAENAECGNNARTYTAGDPDWFSSEFCSAGTLSGSTPSFPGAPGSVSWNCNGSNGGEDKTCVATRLAPVIGQCDTSVSCATSKPTTKLCAKGSPGTVSGTGPWTWTCSGTPPADCSRSKCKGSPYKEVTP